LAMSNRAAAPPRGRLLVADDEPFLCDAIATSLRLLGFEVTTAGTGASALRLARDQSFDLVVLDVMMPEPDGFEIVRRLRRDGSQVPVIFLTARDTQEDKVAGLTLGGDDYLTKPFSLEEVVARVQAILRRVRPSTNQQALLRVADLVMDTHTHEVWRGDVSVHLTATEFALLRYFMVNPRRVLSKSQILSAVWHSDFDVDENVVETYVSYLRKKLHRHGPPVIDTVRLVGYALRPVAA